MSLKRYFFLGLGWFSVGLASLGIAMPILPTVPFLLVAVWAFSKSSPELAEKFRNHPKFGPLIRAWQDHGVIPAYAKVLAMLMMSGTGGYLVFYSRAPQWVGYGACAVMVGLAVYILSRPSFPPVA